jgi:hypothetical protein
MRPRSQGETDYEEKKFKDEANWKQDAMINAYIVQAPV